MTKQEQTILSHLHSAIRTSSETMDWFLGDAQGFGEFGPSHHATLEVMLGNAEAHLRQARLKLGALVSE